MTVNYLIIYLFLLTSNLFSQTQTLWDFGVTIDKKTNSSIILKKSNDLNTKLKKTTNNIDAAIADPFIEPKQLNLSNDTKHKIDETEFIINPDEIKAVIDKSYFTKNYQNIINILSHNKLNIISSEDYIDLNYILAESLYHTGKYNKAKNNTLALLKKYKSDRLYFLLSMIYEALGEIENAKNTYSQIIISYPDSDYFNSAKIKSNILNKN